MLSSISVSCSGEKPSFRFPLVFISNFSMKFLLISALQAVSIVALAVRDPQITPPVLVPRQAGLDEFYSSLGGPNEFIVTNLGPSNSLLSYNGKSYHVSSLPLQIYGDDDLMFSKVYRGAHQILFGSYNYYYQQRP